MQQDVPFEKSLEELESIIKSLEEGNIPLSEMVALYEKGAALGKQCMAQLDSYEQKLTTLTLGKED